METSLIVVLAVGLLIGIHQIIIAVTGREKLTEAELKALKSYYEAVLGVELMIEGGREADAEVAEGWGERIAAWNAEFMMRV